MKLFLVLLLALPSLSFAHIVIKTSPQGTRGVIEFDETTPATGSKVTLDKDNQGSIVVLIEKVSGKKAMVKLISGSPLIMGETLADTMEQETPVAEPKSSTSVKKNRFILGVGGTYLGLGELEGFGSYQGNPEIEASTGFNIYGGMEFNKIFMIGAYYRKYSSEGTFANKTLVRSNDPAKIITTPDGIIPDAEFSDFGIMAQYHFPFGFYGQATYGLTSLTMSHQVRIGINNPAILEYDMSGSDISISVGYRYNITEMIFVNTDIGYRTASYDKIEVNSQNYKLQEATEINGLIFNFGVGASF